MWENVLVLRTQTLEIFRSGSQGIMSATQPPRLWREGRGAGQGHVRHCGTSSVQKLTDNVEHAQSWPKGPACHTLPLSGSDHTHRHSLGTTEKRRSPVTRAGQEHMQRIAPPDGSNRRKSRERGTDGGQPQEGQRDRAWCSDRHQSGALRNSCLK